MQAFAGIVTVSVGHCHPEVVAAVNKQNELLQHTTTIYLNNQIAEYAKELADKMPGNLKVTSCPSLMALPLGSVACLQTLQAAGFSASSQPATAAGAVSKCTQPRTLHSITATPPAASWCFNF